ncbi:hypothetical protein HYH03_005985 [Edaphochlamys debaryana]|uniref:Uncharacterized protein n=1 Tax=Edaphochlamys debaryana TaxID=47281 RepID=A0A835Y4X8_9CHLO|nr:hypothetical protein HYH03_005985 [Edaphochlamys debaryana]|eukprot:KAG2496066.1 hypothetical protein HYH03_005985 [Edaphochlamys debaryana]
MVSNGDGAGGDLPQLVQACRELDSVPPPLSDSHAHAFFSDFTLERLFRALSEARDKDHVAVVSDALGRLLATDLGQSMLPSALPYLEAASTSPLPPLRRLAADQYGSLLLNTIRQRDATDDAATTACLQLVGILSDPDASVAAAAARAVKAYVSAGGASALRRLLGPGSPVAAALAASAEEDRTGGTVRLRVTALALELAAAAVEGESRPYANGHHGAEPASTSARADDSALRPMELLRGSGLLQPLLQQLADPSDALACLAALQLLEEVLATAADGGGGGGTEAVAAALAELALPQLLCVVSNPMLSDAAMPLVAGIIRRSLPEALPPAALAAAEAAAAAAQPLPPTLRAAPALLAAVRSVLDEAGDASTQAEACGLDAVLALGQSRGGAQLVLVDEAVTRGLCERALGRSPHPELRCAALHAVAAVAGLERAGEERCRAAALLPAQAEDALRRGVFGACGLKRPGEVLLALLGQPFAESRVAAYRCLAALALRAWFAVEVVTTPDLLQRITNADSESGATACQWRHAAAAAIWATLAAAGRGELSAGEEALAATLTAPSMVERVRSAVAGGPYGVDGGAGGAAAAEAAARMHNEHHVATRGGGGGV